MKQPDLRCSFAAGAMLLALTSTPAWAQPDFSGLKIKPGDTVYVTPASGATVSGTVTAVTSQSLTLDGRQFRPEAGLTIARRGDSLLNGFLIGFGIGAVVSPIVGAEACPEHKIGCVIGGGISYGALGLLIDSRIKGRTVIYRAPQSGAALRVLPTITPEAKAIRFSLSF